MNDTVIRVENLGKRYRIGASPERYKTLRDTLVSGIKAPIQKLQHASTARHASTGPNLIWAVREKIYLNAAILGMKRLEIERKFDEIVAFSEVEQFIDTPVKRYSSGMYLRLAFAVAAHLEPEI